MLEKAAVGGEHRLCQGLENVTWSKMRKRFALILQQQHLKTGVPHTHKKVYFPKYAHLYTIMSNMLVF